MSNRLAFSIALGFIVNTIGSARDCQVKFNLFDPFGEPSESVIIGVKVGSDGAWLEMGKDLPATKARIIGSSVVLTGFRGESILAQLKPKVGGSAWFKVTPLSCPYEIDVSLEHPDRSIGEISSRVLKGRIPQDKSKAHWVRLIPLFGGQEPRLFTGTVDAKGGFEVRGNFASSFHLLMWGSGRVVLGCRGFSVPDGHGIDLELRGTDVVQGCDFRNVKVLRTY